MAIRTNTNPHPLDLPPELQDILQRNGMQARIVTSNNAYALMVQGHDSPLLQYAISERQLRALTDWGTNSANRKAYNTFASIVAADFDLPKDFVHARNANGRVAMGLHGYRIGAGEYGRQAMPRRDMPPHMMGGGFLGWTPRQQEGWHMRRIGGNVYFPGAPMVPTRPDGRMKPGELSAGGYGFYYKPSTVAPVAQQDVLTSLQTVVQPISQPQRPTTPAIPYKEAITSDVYFSNEKWQEVLASHGIVIDATKKTLTIQSSGVEADMIYNLKDEELAILTDNSIKNHSVKERLDVLNNILKDDFANPITMEHLNSTKIVDIQLHPEVLEDLNRQLTAQQNAVAQQGKQTETEVQQEQLPKGTMVMDGNDLDLLDERKGWFREGRHGREVTVDDIRVEPAEVEGKFKMTAVIDSETVSHEISKKQYDKFMALDDLHRMKLFSKIFGEVDMKTRDRTPLGVKIGAALSAGLTVTHELMHGAHPAPELYGGGPAPMPHVYHKPGVDTPADVAARQFDAMMNNPHTPHGPMRGM